MSETMLGISAELGLRVVSVQLVADLHCIKSITMDTQVRDCCQRKFHNRIDLTASQQCLQLNKDLRSSVETVPLL